MGITSYLINTVFNAIYPSHMDHDGIAVRLIPFKALFFASTRHNSRRIPSHHNFDFELSRWCHCHPKQEWHACDSSVDLSYVMSDVQLVQLVFTEEDTPLKTKMTPSRVVVDRQAIPSKMVPIPEDMLNIVKLLVIQGFVSVATSCSSSTGIVEWVLDTETLGEILVGSGNTDGAHQRPELPTGKCRTSHVPLETYRFVVQDMAFQVPSGFDEIHLYRW